MYNIFNIKNSKRPIPLAEDEPPPKKLITDGDLFIKELSEKQLTTKTSLSEQLNTTKVFTKSIESSVLSKFHGGTSTLTGFQSKIDTVEDIDKLKALGLTDNEIEFYNDYKRGGKSTIYKHASEEHVKTTLEKIGKLIEKQDSLSKDTISTTHQNHRHELDILESVKPNSMQSKLLKFALKSELQPNETIPHPIGDIKNIEKDFMTNLSYFENVDVKKIRKKARSLRNKIDEIGCCVPEPKSVSNCKPRSESTVSMVASSKWDKTVIETDQGKPVVSSGKLYGCIPESKQLYTIKNGEIVKIPSNKNEELKLTKVDVKEIPKFSNYEARDPSSILYVKNLVKTIEEVDIWKVLRNVCTELDDSAVSVKCLSGKMKGQAFIYFQNEEIATETLNKLNGIVFKNRPMVVQFGKKKS